VDVLFIFVEKESKTKSRNLERKLWPNHCLQGFFSRYWCWIQWSSSVAFSR